MVVLARRGDGGGGGGGGDQFVLNGWFVGLSQGCKRFLN